MKDQDCVERFGLEQDMLDAKHEHALPHTVTNMCTNQCPNLTLPTSPHHPWSYERMHDPCTGKCMQRAHHSTHSQSTYTITSVCCTLCTVWFRSGLFTVLFRQESISVDMMLNADQLKAQVFIPKKRLHLYVLYKKNKNKMTDATETLLWGIRGHGDEYNHV